MKKALFKNKVLWITMCLLLIAFIVILYFFINKNNATVHIKNEKYDITIEPPQDYTYPNYIREYTADVYLHNDAGMQQNETICQVINEVIDYIHRNNIQEKFRIYISPDTDSHHVLQFYNYCDASIYLNDEDDPPEYEDENMDFTDNFISCKYNIPLAYNDNIINKKIDLFNELGIKYLYVFGDNASSIMMRELDYSDIEKCRSFALLIGSKFYISSELYEKIKNSDVLSPLDEKGNVYQIDCSDRPDLDWHFSDVMIVLEDDPKE